MPSPQSNSPWKLRTIIAGCATLVVALTMMRWNPRTGCGGPLWSSPILVFEFLRSTPDVVALFGSPGQCQQQLLATFFVLNRIDYLFMPAYGSLVVSGSLAMRDHYGRNDPAIFSRLAVVAGALAPMADALENYYLLQFSPSSPTFPLLVLQFFVAAKFLLLALVATLVGRWQWRSTVSGWRYSALVHWMALPIVVLAVIAPHRFLALLQLPFLLSWVMLLVWAIVHRQRAR